MRPIPRQPVPALSVETIAHGRWNLADSKPANFTLIVVYRGLHCPICRPYLSELNRLAGEFVQRGVEVIALSSDNAERAAQAVRDWKLIATRVGYGLSIDDARTWGLYVSTSRGKTSTGFEEPALFAEPGNLPHSARRHPLFSRWFRRCPSHGPILARSCRRSIS